MSAQQRAPSVEHSHSVFKQRVEFTLSPNPDDLIRADTGPPEWRKAKTGTQAAIFAAMAKKQKITTPKKKQLVQHHQQPEYLKVL